MLKKIIPLLSIVIILATGACATPLSEQINQGDKYSDQKDWNSAISAYQKALGIDSKSIQSNQKLALAYNNRGHDYNQKQQWDTAIADFNSSLNYDASLTIAFNNRGYAYYGKGQSSLATAYSLLNSGDDKGALKEIDSAIGYFGQSIDNLNQALKLDSGFKEAKNNLANSYNDRGHAYNIKKEWDKAIADLTRAIELNPQLPEAYNDRGWAYNGKKDWDAAIPDLNKAIKMRPGMALAYNNRGWALHEKNKYNEALIDLNKAISLDPNMTVAYLNRGITYYYINNKDLGIKDFRQVLIMTKDPELVYGAKQGLSLFGITTN